MSCEVCEENDHADCPERETLPYQVCCCGQLGPDWELVAEERLHARDYEAWSRL